VKLEPADVDFEWPADVVNPAILERNTVANGPFVKECKKKEGHAVGIFESDYEIVFCENLPPSVPQSLASEPLPRHGKSVYIKYAPTGWTRKRPQAKPDTRWAAGRRPIERDLASVSLLDSEPEFAVRPEEFTLFPSGYIVLPVEVDTARTAHAYCWHAPGANRANADDRSLANHDEMTRMNWSIGEQVCKFYPTENESRSALSGGFEKKDQCQSNRG
jgi:hypothetical protein